MNNKIFVPNKNGKCYQLIDRHTLRVYTDDIGYNRNINYYDVYLDSHYYATGNQTAWFWWNDNNNHAQLPSCLNQNDITDDFYYRNDFDSILIIFLILSIFVFFIPYKVLSRMFGRWLKV